MLCCSCLTALNSLTVTLLGKADGICFCVAVLAATLVRPEFYSEYSKIKVSYVSSHNASVDPNSQKFMQPSNSETEQVTLDAAWKVQS
jgi:hypothetical protein